MDASEGPRQEAADTERALRELHARGLDVLNESLRGNQAEIGQLLQLDRDIWEWEKRLVGRPEVQQLTDSRRELGFAIYAAATGSYGLAFAGLRLFLELSFAAVYFSANEFTRRKWASDRADFSWSAALDQDHGVLSKSFVVEFNEPAAVTAYAYASVASRCYRQCSQFVHGKLAATNQLPRNLAYSSEALSAWTRTARDAARATLYLLFCRYGEELLMQDDGRLGSTLEHSFSHDLAVRKVLGLPIEDR